MDPELHGSHVPSGPGAGDPGFRAALSLRRLGETVRADALCAAVLRADPGHFDAYHLRGLIALESGELDRGIELIERSLAINGNQPLAHSNLGNAFLSAGQPQRALDSLDRALRLKPDLPIAHYNRGNALKDLARLEEALLSYEAALGLDPSHAKALNNRGIALQELGRLTEARSSFEQASERDPLFAASQINLAQVLLKLDLPLEALAVGERLVERQPADPEAIRGLGNALFALERFEAAIDCYTRALQIQPECVEALMSRSAVWQRLKRLEPALADCELALQLRPESVVALCNSGNVLLALGRARPALACYERALALAPEDGSALHGRGAALVELGRLEEAAQAFSELLHVQPDHHSALGNLFHLRMEQCDWHDHDDLSARALDSLRRTRRFVNPLSSLLHDDSWLKLDCARAFVEERFPPQPSLGPLPPGGARDRNEIRVAYVSADFTDHPVAHLLVGVLERHDREQFDIVGVSLRPRSKGSFEERVHGALDRSIDASAMSDRDIAGLMRELGVDIAVDLMGFTEGSRFGIFAHRAAPVQVNYLGWAGTTGATYMDYLLADGVVIPEGDGHWYSEQVVRLPGCYLPTDEGRALGAAPTRDQAGLPQPAFVFCAFTKAHKINPRMFQIWMRLLRETEGSVLWLRDMGPVVRAHLTREAERLGIRGERLVFAPRVAGAAEHLARHALADLVLDTLPYNAHSTTCDALWAGVPVLTCAGNGFASRTAASALVAAALPELVTQSLEQYERRALDLARRPQWLRQLRSRLTRQDNMPPLFDTAGYTRHLEAAFRRMHERAARGEPAISFSIEPGWPHA
jgi:predicted O-linked N-acetylglucosamine transferase (SPINDLY family)